MRQTHRARRFILQLSAPTSCYVLEVCKVRKAHVKKPRSHEWRTHYSYHVSSTTCVSIDSISPHKNYLNSATRECGSGARGKDSIFSIVTKKNHSCASGYCDIATERPNDGIETYRQNMKAKSVPIQIKRNSLTARVSACQQHHLCIQSK